MWDVTKEFSIAANPNGVWSYGYATSLNAPFTLFPFPATNSVCIRWYSNLDPYGFHAINRTFDGVGFNDGQNPPTIMPPGTLWLHPGDSGQVTILRWTAPFSGTFRAHGSFTTRCVGLVGVYLRVNETILYQSTMQGYLSNRAFDQTVSLSQGEIVDFIVTDGGNGWDFDSTSLDARIESQ